MVDVATWNKLTLEEQQEFDSVLSKYATAIQDSRARDGIEFAQMYRVDSDGESYFITDGKEIVGGIKYKSKALVNALFREAVMNYGR